MPDHRLRRAKEFDVRDGFFIRLCPESRGSVLAIALEIKRGKIAVGGEQILLREPRYTYTWIWDGDEFFWPRPTKPCCVTRTVWYPMYMCP